MPLLSYTSQDLGKILINKVLQLSTSSKENILLYVQLSLSGTFNEVLIEIAGGYTIDRVSVVCRDEEEWENLRKEAKPMPSAYCSNKTLRTESVRIKEVLFAGAHCQETIPECTLHIYVTQDCSWTEPHGVMSNLKQITAAVNQSSYSPAGWATQARVHGAIIIYSQGWGMGWVWGVVA